MPMGKSTEEIAWPRGGVGMKGVLGFVYGGTDVSQEREKNGVDLYNRSDFGG